jgi:hypothetical protein
VGSSESSAGSGAEKSSGDGRAHRAAIRRAVEERSSSMEVSGGDAFAAVRGGPSDDAG